METHRKSDYLPPKRSRNIMSYKQKMKVIEQIRNGSSYAQVGRFFGVNESTIRSICKNEGVIRYKVAHGHGAQKTNWTKRGQYLDEVEKIVLEWLEQQSMKKNTLTAEFVRSEAKRAYNIYVHPMGGMKKQFAASKTWFDAFVKRNRIDDGVFCGQFPMNEMESSDDLTKIIEVMDGISLAHEHCKILVFSEYVQSNFR